MKNSGRGSADALVILLAMVVLIAVMFVAADAVSGYVWTQAAPIVQVAK